MDELRAAEVIRYFANQYADLSFVAAQLETIGSLKGQIESLVARQVEVSLAVDAKTEELQALVLQHELKKEEHDREMTELARAYSQQSAQLQDALEEQQRSVDLDILHRKEEAEKEFQAARDAHQTQMAELHAQLAALGRRVEDATADAVEAEARRDRAQDVVNKLQSTIEAIKFQGVDA